MSKIRISILSLLVALFSVSLFVGGCGNNTAQDTTPSSDQDAAKKATANSTGDQSAKVQRFKPGQAAK